MSRRKRERNRLSYDKAAVTGLGRRRSCNASFVSQLIPQNKVLLQITTPGSEFFQISIPKFYKAPHSVQFTHTMGQKE